MRRCANCEFYWTDKGERYGSCHAPCNDEAPCERGETETPARYTVMYEGYLFDGDKADGLNMHDYDNWDEVQSLINFYGDVIEVRDNWYDVHWYKGGWI